MFDKNCDCENCEDPCEYQEKLLNFKSSSGLTQKRFAEMISETLSTLVAEPYVQFPIVIFFKGDQVIVSDSLGMFEDFNEREKFIEAMRAGWLYFQPEALLWYGEAWSSKSSAVLSGEMRARDCPERYEIIAANGYHAESHWRFHVEMKIEGEGVMRRVVSAEELDVFDEVGLRIMSRLGTASRGSITTH